VAWLLTIVSVTANAILTGQYNSAGIVAWLILSVVKGVFELKLGWLIVVPTSSTYDDVWSVSSLFLWYILTLLICASLIPVFPGNLLMPLVGVKAGQYLFSMQPWHPYLCHLTFSWNVNDYYSLISSLNSVQLTMKLLSQSAEMKLMMTIQYANSDVSCASSLCQRLMAWLSFVSI
jgi:hypothetical protein